MCTLHLTRPYYQLNRSEALNQELIAIWEFAHKLQTFKIQQRPSLDILYWPLNPSSWQNDHLHTCDKSFKTINTLFTFITHCVYLLELHLLQKFNFTTSQLGKNLCGQTLHKHLCICSRKASLETFLKAHCPPSLCNSTTKPHQIRRLAAKLLLAKLWAFSDCAFKKKNLLTSGSSVM